MRQVLEDADIILSKGQANFETLVTSGRNIYYIFLCKCVRFTRLFDVPMLTGMFCRERDIHIETPFYEKKDKSFTRFFQKIAVSKGRAFGRWPQPAKFPPAAAGETPAPRHGAKSPIVKAPSADGAISAAYAARAAVPHPVSGWWTAALLCPVDRWCSVQASSPSVDIGPYRVQHIIRRAAASLTRPQCPPIRGRQGCRPLRFACSVMRISGGTHRSRPTLPVGSLSGFVGHCANWFPMQSFFCVSCIK